MEKEAKAVIKYIGDRLPKPDWETARDMVSSPDRKGFVYLAKPNSQYTGKVLMMSDTHLVQQVGKNAAIAHDLSKIENSTELEKQFDEGLIKVGQTSIKVEYSQDQGKADVFSYNQQRAESVRMQAEKWAEQHITNAQNRGTFVNHVRAFVQDLAKGQAAAKPQSQQTKPAEKPLHQQHQRTR